MALKKKTSGGNEDRAAQLAYLKSSAKDLSKAAKKDAPAGYTTTPDIIKAFGLKKGKTATTQAKVTQIRTGMTKGDLKKKIKPAMYVSFNLVCVGSTGKGQTPGIMIVIQEKKTKGGIRGKDKALEDVIYTMQRIGIDTKAIDSETDLFDVIDEFNGKERADKPVVSITLSTWGEKNDGLNVKINKLLEDFEEEDGEDESEEEDEDDESDSDDDESGDSDDEDEDEAEDDEKPSKSKSAKSSKSTKSKSKSKSDDDDDDEEEEDEDAEEDSDDEEEEDEEEVEYDAEDPSTWVGYECTAKPNGYAKKTKFEITEYIAKGKKLKIKDSKGKVVTVAATVVTIV